MACSSATCCSGCAKCMTIGLFVFIIICIIGAIKAPSTMNTIVSNAVDNVVKKLMVLNPSSELYENWLEPAIPAYQRIYFFDIQNPDEIMQGAKPRVKEVGPYTYRLIASRFNASFGDNDTLSFRQMVSWSTFIPEMSDGLENDTITTINIPLAAMVQGIKDMDWFTRLTVSAIATIHNQKMFTKLTVEELLWGYEDAVLKNMQDLGGKDLVPTTIAGILHTQNGSTESYTVNTGVTEQKMLNRILEWNGVKSLSWWKTEQANMINGSDGSILHPKMERDEIVYLFDPGYCRSLPLIYQNDTSYVDIPMMIFYLPPYTYANASDYPPNAGFCLAESCPSGIFNISACAQGAPMGSSLPHFLYASPDIIDSIDGIQPNESNHQTYFVVEPVTGSPFIQYRRIQMNVYMEPVDGIMQTYDMRSLYYPLLWIETSVILPKFVAEEFKNRMSAAYGYGTYVQYGFIVAILISFILMLSMVACLKSKRCKSKVGKEHRNGDPYVVFTKELSNGEIHRNNLTCLNMDEHDQTKNGDIPRNGGTTAEHALLSKELPPVKQDEDHEATPLKIDSDTDTDLNRSVGSHIDSDTAEV